jgi:hypothetical protein
MSNVSFEHFCNQFAAVLEIEGKHFLHCPLGDIPEYDSMGRITISLMIESLFSYQIPYEILDQSKDISSLYEYCINFKN